MEGMVNSSKFPLVFNGDAEMKKNIGVRIPLLIIHIRTMEEKLAKSISRNTCLAFVGFDLSELGKHGKCRDSINVSCLILEPIISIALLLFILLV